MAVRGVRVVYLVFLLAGLAGGFFAGFVAWGQVQSSGFEYRVGYDVSVTVNSATTPAWSASYTGGLAAAGTALVANTVVVVLQVVADGVNAVYSEVGGRYVWPVATETVTNTLTEYVTTTVSSVIQRVQTVVDTVTVGEGGGGSAALIILPLLAGLALLLGAIMRRG